MVTHLVGWAPAVVTAVMSASNSSLQMCKFSGVGTGCGGSIQFIFANVQIYHKMVNNLLRSYKIFKKSCNSIKWCQSSSRDPDIFCQIRIGPNKSTNLCKKNIVEVSVKIQMVFALWVEIVYLNNRIRYKLRRTRISESGSRQNVTVIVQWWDTYSSCTIFW